MTDYHRSPVLKHALWISFMGSISLTMVPMINMLALPVIYDAMFATGFTMGGLGLVAYNAPSEQFIMWEGFLSMALAGMVGLSVLSMFRPSPMLTNIWLYGGLLLFSAYVLYDTQKLMKNAKTRPTWDPINESFGLYMDAINLFIRFAMMFNNNKKK